MPTVVGILTFMSMLNFMLSLGEHGKKFNNLKAWSLSEQAGLSPSPNQEERVSRDEPIHMLTLKMPITTKVNSFIIG